jgi:EmrB/QacA subfamily drug resistance transporter
MTSATVSGPVQTTNRIEGPRRWWALATVMLTMLFASLDQTVVSTAMPTVIADLQGFSLYTWVFSAYMLTSAVTVPIYGKLSDVFGRRPFYLFGLIVFALGSAVSGMAHSMLQLVLARAFQGIGAGAMMSMPRATIGDIFDPKERSRWMGAMGALFGLSSILGPAIGGFITEHWSWRWVFYINLPVAVLAILGVAFALPKVRTPHRAQVDWWGTALLIAGLVPILLAFTWAGSRYKWTDPVLWLWFGGGAVLLALFLWQERRAADPVLAPQLFRNRIFVVSLFLALFVSMTMFSSLMFLPVYVQGVIGLNPENSGYLMTPMMFSFIIGSMVIGQWMSRTGRYLRLAKACGAVIILGSALLTQLYVDTPYWVVAVDMVVLGLGIGGLMPVANVAVQNAFPYRMMGTVNSTQQFVNSLGGVVAAPIFGSIMNHRFASALSEHLPKALEGPALASLNPQSLITKQAQQQIAAAFGHFGPAGQTLYHSFINGVKLSLTEATHTLFLVGLVFAVLTFVGTWFLPEVRLKGKEYFTEDADTVATLSQPRGDQA